MHGAAAWNWSPGGWTLAHDQSDRSGRRPLVITVLVSVLLIATLSTLALTHGLSSDSSSSGASPTTDPGPAVTQNSLTPAPTGTLEMGQGSAPIPWDRVTSDSQQTFATVPGGIEMTIHPSGYDYWTPVPVDNSFTSTSVTGDVQFVSGGSDSAIGLGCASPDETTQLGFHLFDDGSWTLAYYARTASAIVDIDSGSSPAIRPTSQVNALSVHCGPAPDDPGGTVVVLTVNGTTVANDDVALTETAWQPTIDQCSCGGSDTGRFTQVAQYSD
jgi:hypothetical protein